MTRQVWEIYLLASCVMLGLMGSLIPATRARSIVNAFPDILQGLWYVGMFCCGAVGILAIYGGGILGVLAERVALVTLALFCLSYGTASVAFAGPSGLSGSILLLGFAVPCITRAWQITTELNQLRSVVHHLAEEAEGHCG
jgi:hypothetical protein